MSISIKKIRLEFKRLGALILAERDEVSQVPPKRLDANS
jgi:hypothetical protein